MPANIEAICKLEICKCFFIWINILNELKSKYLFNRYIVLSFFTIPSFFTKSQLNV